ncbi:MAG: carbon monoxide dehydrogenase [Armatimonadota bacterium]|jgi:CO dehydrogenase maturation factor
MSQVIAIAGKGGSGKSSLAAGLVLQLLASDRRPVLAVDADPNSTLGYFLGCEWTETMADIREDREPPTGMSRPDYMALRMQECLAEHDGFDLLVMGRPEGPGCYCAVNNLLRRELADLTDGYGAVVIDNEAGMEHLSRRTSGGVDALLVAAQPTRVSLISAQRVLETARSNGIATGRTILVLNGVRGEPAPELTAEAEGLGCDSVLPLPWSEQLWQLSQEGKAVAELDKRSPWCSGVAAALDVALHEHGTGG